MSGHTPGPWRVEEGERLIWGNCQDDAPRISGGYPVAEARTKWQSGNWAKRPDADEAQANARLVAAAPDLLEALEAFVAKYVEIADSGDCGFWDPEEEDFVIAARAAIAKARGKDHA